jgi:hypothetical protein
VIVVAPFLERPSNQAWLCGSRAHVEAYVARVVERLGAPN